MVVVVGKSLAELGARPTPRRIDVAASAGQVGLRGIFRKSLCLTRRHGNHGARKQEGKSDSGDAAENCRKRD